MIKLFKLLLILLSIPISFLAYKSYSDVSVFINLKNNNELLYNDVSNIQSELKETQERFLDNRKFGIPFSDTRGILTMFKSISGFNVTSIKALDASKGFEEAGDFIMEDYSTVDGLKVTLTVNDVKRALDILNSMQLPILELTIRNSVIEVSFNTRQVI